MRPRRKVSLTTVIAVEVILATVYALVTSLKIQDGILLGLFLIAAFLCFLLILREGRQKGRRARGCCLNCGYDLRATPERCPECGTQKR